MDEDEKLYKLYALNNENMKHYLSEHQRRVSFYIGLISALITITIAGVIKSEKWYHFLPLTLGPITILVISWIAKKGVDRFYQRFLESITTLKKIEYDFGLLEERNNESKDNNWVAKECFTPLRYKKSPYKSSQEWVDKHMRFSGKEIKGKNTRERNYNGVVIFLFNATSVLAVVLFFMIIIIWYIEIIEQVLRYS